MPHKSPHNWFRTFRSRTSARIRASWSLRPHRELLKFKFHILQFPIFWPRNVYLNEEYFWKIQKFICEICVNYPSRRCSMSPTVGLNIGSISWIFLYETGSKSIRFIKITSRWSIIARIGHTCMAGWPSVIWRAVTTLLGSGLKFKKILSKIINNRIF